MAKNQGISLIFLLRPLIAKKRLILSLTTSLTFLISAITVNNTTIAATSSSTQTPNIASPAVTLTASAKSATAENKIGSIVSIDNYTKTYFKDKPILAKIAECESHYRQFDFDGSVFRGVVVPEDVGVMQINETYHKKTAEKLGINIYSLDGNLAYAEYLYDNQGTAPWSASKACWNK